MAGQRTYPEARRWPVILVSATAAIGGFLFGFDTAVINGTVNAVRDEFQMSAAGIGFVVSAALLGCVVGAWIAGPVADRIGRVRVMLITAATFIVSAVGSALAPDPFTLTAFRILGGLAVGAASVIAPAYIAEIAPAGRRGRLGSLQQLAIVVGIFAALLTDYAIASAAGGAAEQTPWGGAAWRWMFASAVIPAAAWAVLALRIPESPRYLVRKGQEDDARTVLARFVGGDVAARVEAIKETLAGRIGQVRLSDLRGPRLGLLPIVWVGILLSVFQQFVGINVIFYYSTTLWRSVGFTEADALFTSVVNSAVNIIGTFVGIALIDRIGRKPLLLIGAAAMAVNLGLLALTFTTATATGTGDEVTLGPVAGPVALVAANLYVFAYAFSWGPAVWVLLGEMFNNVIRATALAVAASAQWLANWLITTSFPVLAGVSVALAYGLYTAFAVLAFIFVATALRETRGRQLEEM